MRILLISGTFGISKPKSGGQNRFSNLVKILSNNSCNTIILESQKVFSSEDQKFGKVYTYPEGRHILNKTLCRDVDIIFLIKLSKILKKEHVDLIQIEHPSGLIAAGILKKLMRKPVIIIYDAHNFYKKYSKEIFPNNKVLAFYLSTIEKFGCKYVNYIFSVSYEEKRLFKEHYKIPCERIFVIPSGCNIPKLPNKHGNRKRQKVIFFHGTYFHPPNKEAFDLIVQKISKEFKNRNDVVFLIGGLNVPMFEDANVKSLGFIKDIKAILTKIDIAIVPLKRGGGTKLKVFDYMSAGLPIVTTKKGAEGIDLVNGKHAIIVDDVNEEFIKAIEYLIENPKIRKKLGHNARKLAEKKYSWERIGEMISNVLRKINLNNDLRI